MSQYRWLKILLVLLIAAALPGLAAALAQEASAWPPSTAPEIEPNDTPWEATYLSGWRQGRINPVGDVDYYRGFSTLPGLNLYIDLRMPPNSPLLPVATLYDENENVLASATCDGVLVCLSLTVPEADELYLRIEDGHGAGGPAYEYEVQARYSDPHEPNNFISQATPFTPGEPLPAMIEPAGDVDFYIFTAEAGQEFYIGNGGVSMFLLDEAGRQIGYVSQYYDAVLKFEATGTYYFQTDEDDYYGPHPYTLHLAAVDRPLLFSFTKAGTLGGVAFQPGDIVRYSPLHDAWSMHFDASDMGLRGNLIAFSGEEHLMLTYATAQNLPDVGRVRPQDVLEFYPYSTGEDTIGFLQMRMAGVDVGLTTAAESIDAMAGYLFNYKVYVSTKGNARLPMSVGVLTAQRDDVIVIDGNSSGEITGGDWGVYLDGHQMGLNGANLIALSNGVDGYGYYLMYDRAVTLGGVTYQRNDVIFCATAAEESTTCDSYEEVFDGALVGDYVIDALSALAFETP